LTTGRPPSATMPARTEAGPVEIAARNRRCVPSAAIGMLGGTVFALIVACSVYGCRARSSSPDRRADPAAAATAVVAGGPGSPSTGMQAAQDAPTPREPGPGEVIEQEADVSFDPERWVVSTLRPMERHPLSSLAEVQRRVGWADSEMDAAADDYDPTQESFEVAVPPSPMDPDGLLVWIPAAPSGAMPPELGPALEKCHVRYAGLNNAGNERPVAVRMNLALDAVHAVCQRMPVRPDRIWVGGISGGGKTASRMALLYPEVFRGGLFVVGASYFPPVPMRDTSLASTT